MIELIKTNLFNRWLIDLRDRKARAKIETRIRRLSLGNPGDVKPVGEEYLKYESTMAPDTACITCSTAL